MALVPGGWIAVNILWLSAWGLRCGVSAAALTGAEGVQLGTYLYLCPGNSAHPGL